MGFIYGETMRKTVSVLLIIFLLIGVCGCMNTNQNKDIDREIRSELMRYAVAQYGGEYEVVFYQTAVDATQSYVLCLRDKDGYIFNVYEHAETGNKIDDYKNCIVDKKMNEHLMKFLEIDEKDTSIASMAVMNISEDVDVLKNMTLEECVDKHTLFSLIFAYHFEGEKGSIISKADVLLDIYNKLCTINTDTIDFNVVVTSGDASEVVNVLNNMRYGYSGCWYSRANVMEYISEANPTLNTLDDLKAIVKE